MKNITTIILILLVFSWNMIYSQQEDILSKTIKEIDAIDKEKVEKEKKISFIDRISIPSIYVSADLLSTFDIPINEKIQYSDFLFDLRELELSFSGAVDQLVYLHTGIAVHREESGDIELSLHELYVEFPTIFQGFNLKLGHMFIDIGKINNIHLHDRNFTTAPKVHQYTFNDELFGEGAGDIGVEISYFLPYPANLPFTQKILFGIFLGRGFGHFHGFGDDKHQPLYTASLENFFLITRELAFETNFNFFRYSVNTTPNDADYAYGVDSFFKWKRVHYILRIGGEFWYREQMRSEEPNDSNIGYYIYTEFTLLKQYQMGYRWAHNIETDNKTTGKTDKKTDTENAVWFAYKVSEFTRFRLTFEHHNFYEEGEEFIVYLQMTFSIGRHPAHAFH